MSQRRLWEVVGGSAKGGVLVRQGQDLSSPEEATRLATGATVRELALHGGRLHYELVTGTGPATGWVSVKVPENKVLLAPLATREPSAPSREPAAAVRKLRLLAVHSAPANSNFMRFQTTQLRKAFGKSAEWLFVDAPNVWQPQPLPPGHRDGEEVSAAWLLYGAERTELDRRLAGDKPFAEWLCFDEDRMVSNPEKAELSLRHLRAFAEQSGPIDVAVAISQGTCVLAALLEQYRASGQEVPWRLSLFFNYVPPEWHRLSPEPAERIGHPVVAILGGSTDPWTEIGQPALGKRFSDAMVLSHEDGHCFPATEPTAGEIYRQLAALVQAKCASLEA